MNSLTIRILPGLLIGFAAATSCTNDRSLPSEPVQEVAYESAVVESNGGYVPDSTIVMYQGETESTLFTFTTGIGECDPTCAYIDGSPWGVSFGYPDGDDYPNGNQTWRIMSAGYAKSDQAPRQSFIEFDPPVRSVTFIYDAGACGGFNGGSGCVDDFWVGALDISFLTIHSDTVYADPPGGGTWTEISFGDPVRSDRIRWLWFQGILNIDNLQILRGAPPAIVCDTVARGASTECRVRPEAAAGLDSVTHWGIDAEVVDSTVAISGADSGLEWSGIAIAPGTVTATGWVDDDSFSLSGSLVVNSRTGSDWSWDLSDWDFTEGGGLNCGQFAKLVLSPGAAIKLGQNLRTTVCLDGQIEPPPSQSDTTVDISRINDGGPGHGLWYVTSVRYGMDTGSIINPSIMAGYPPDPLHNKDKNRCATGRDSANFFDFNTECLGRDVGVLLDGIYLHEGHGSTGINGHESQRRLAAVLPAYDPETLVESLTDVSDFGLRDKIRLRVLDLDGELTIAADPGHIVVQGNYSATYDVLRSNGQFKPEVLEDVYP